MTTGNEIAIIGLAGRFPGAPDVRTFWRNLRDGVESISFFGDDDLETSALVPDGARGHHGFVPAGGVLDDAERFDHDLFGLSPREARWMDPQLRVFLETAWAALEDAGHDPAGYPGRISVYAGAGTSDHLLSVLDEVNRDPATDPAALYEAMSGATGDSLATRVSFALGLRGEGVTVHTACSTGLAAVHLAVQSLLLGQSGMALAGAARVMLPQRTGYVHSDGLILSPDGHCRAFDHRAAGTVSGNGVGVVVLRPLADALADGDQIYAVIEGSAMNNDGRRGVGYTAPSVAGQADVITEALAFAGVAGHQVGYVEAHGTGTRLGDPIEIAALTRAYQQSGGHTGRPAGRSPGRPAGQPAGRTADCPIGSVKTNIGHLDAAAGIAGLIKVALMLRHHEIPPSLHLDQPNPSIDFAGGPFFVNTRLRAWEGNGLPRRAGVSSFGIGGTNVHAVVGEAPPRHTDGTPGTNSTDAIPGAGGADGTNDAASSRPAQVVTLSAHTPSALRTMASELADQLERQPAALADVAYTRAVGRAPLRHRRAIVAAELPELIDTLRTDSGLRSTDPVGPSEPRVALLFPGQGAAWHGMAGDLYRAEPAFRAELDGCLAELEPRLRRPLLRALLDGSGPIDDAELAHAGIFAVEYALARLWSSWGIRPVAVLGHSFGEYAAACVAGVLSLPDAAELAVTRGRLVAGLPKGGMLAVGLDEAALWPYLGHAGVSLAAVNGEAQCVVSGPVDALVELRRRLDEAGHASVSLPVRYAFHSPAVEPVMAELEAAAARCAWHAPTVELLSSLTGTWWTEQDGTPAYWARQLREPVRFGAALNALVDSQDASASVESPSTPVESPSTPVESRATRVESRGRGDGRDGRLVLIEVGADQVLTRLARARSGERTHALPSLRRQSGEPHPDHQVLLRSVGEVWCAGVPVDWSAFYGSQRRARIGLPTYPFEGSRFEVRPRPVAAPETPRHRPAAVTAEVNEASVPSAAMVEGDVPTSRLDETAGPTAGSVRMAVRTTGSDETASSTASSDEVERTVLEIWRERLGRDDFGPHDDFLALGGNSLMAAQLLTRLRDAFTVQLPLTALFEAPTVAGVAERIRALLPAAGLDGETAAGEAIRPGEGEELPAVRRISREAELPLSVTQVRTLAIEASDPGNPALVMPLAVLIEGELALDSLRHAIDTVVGRHETLRTTFHRATAHGGAVGGAAGDGAMGDDRWTQRILPATATATATATGPATATATGPATATATGAATGRAPGAGPGIRLESEILTGTADEREHTARLLARTEATEPFDLTRSPLRVRLLKLDDDRHVLLVTVHHVVSDTWSMANLIGEIAAVYRSFSNGDASSGQAAPAADSGDVASLPRLDTQYVDFAGWQRELLDTAALGGQQAYWRRQLADLPEPLGLFGQTGPDRGFRGRRVPAVLPGELADQLRAVGQRLGSTSFVTVLAAYGVLLGRLAGRDEVVVGTPIGNRDRGELEPLIGYVAHALPLRVDLRGDPSFAELVGRLRRVLLSAYANQDVPYEAIVDQIDPARGGGRMFDALLVVHSGLTSQQRVPGAAWSQFDVPDMPAMFGPTMSRLSLMLVESPTGFTGAMEYADELYDADAISGLFEQFGAVLADALARPEAPIAELGSAAGLPAPSSTQPSSIQPVRTEPSRTRPSWTGASWTGAAPVETSPADRNGRVQLSLSYFANDEDALVGPKYRLLLEGAKLADSLGFSAIWTPERHFHPFGGLYPSPGAVNAGLATVTERIGLRAGSVVLPLHDPIRVAEEWSVIDNLSGGRAGVSFASGWNVDDFVLAPEHYADRKRVMAEGIDEVRRLWRGEPVRRRNGEGELVDIRIRPRPVQCELPFWVTAAGSPQTFRMAGELGGFVLTNLMGQSLDALAEKIEAYRAAWRAAGHRTAVDGHVTLMLHAFLADETEQAYAQARGPLLTYFRSSVDIMRGMIASQDVQVRPEDLSEADLTTLLEHGLARYLNEGGLFGTPADCVPMLDRVRELGVDEVAALIDFGAPVDSTLHSVGLLGELIESGTDHETRTRPALRLAEREAGERARERAGERTRGRAEPLPLSYAQQRLWYLDQLEPRNIAYNNPIALRMHGPLDVDALRRALRAVVRRHEILRTTFPATPDGAAVQLVAESIQVELPVVDADEADVEELARQHAREPFDLAHGPLLRARLVRTTTAHQGGTQTEHVLLVCMHHIVSDGWSAGVLFTELASLYLAYVAGAADPDPDSGSGPLPALPAQYADYVGWQRDQVDSATIRDDLAYWNRRLDGVPMLDLPVDRPRGAQQSYAGARSPVRIDRTLADGIGELCRRGGVTPYMVLHAGLATMLHRYSDQTDLAIGTAVAGRNRPEFEQLVGCFVNSVVLRTELSDDPTFDELLDRVKEATLGAVAHAELPFERLVDELDVPRSLSHSPLFQAMLVLHNTPSPRVELGALTLQALEFDPGFAKLDLMLELREGPDGITGSWEYNTDLFDAGTIEQLTRHLIQLLASAVAEPERPLSELDLMPEDERHQVLALSKGARLEIPADEPLGAGIDPAADTADTADTAGADVVPAIFRAQAARTPDAVAVGAYRDDQRPLTYRELEQASNRIAHGLRARGVRPGRLVALLIDDPALAITAMLGVLAAGGGYIPMDPAAPPARLEALVEQARPTLVLTDSEPRSDAGGGELLSVSDVGAGQPADPPPSGPKPEDPAYVIFTSGSTGQPKGVVVEHRQLVYSTRTRRLRYGPAGNCLDLYAATFDVSVGWIHYALLTGGTVFSPSRAMVSDPRAVADLINRQRIERLGCVPGLYAQLLAGADPGLLGSLRIATVAGEAVPPELIRAHTAAMPWAELHNEYGPTEATVFCTAHRLDPHPRGRVPIGRPLPGGQVYVLDRRQRPLPVGAQGELYVGGPGVAREYLGAPELTRERFVPDPIGTPTGTPTRHGHAPARLYRTGDRVRWNRQGVLEFLGRIDRQLKVRGFRVEPGEIEAVLSAHPAVTEAVVVPVEDTGRTRLVGYVALDAGAAAATSTESLLGFARERLPDYLVPAVLVPVPALPRTANGKVDSAALPPERPAAHSSRAVPRTGPEQTLAAVFGEVLGNSEVGVHDDFFASGGDSILAISAVTRIRQQGIDLDVRELFGHPTVAGLARAVAERSSGSSEHDAADGDAPGGSPGRARIERAVEQGTVAGPMPLAPIQRWFFGLGLAEPWHWNMAVQLRLTAPIRAEELQEAFRVVLRHHDALRLRFDPEGRTARTAATEVDWTLDRLDLQPAEESPTAVPAEELPTAAADRLQATCDLSTGPLLRAALVRGASELSDSSDPSELSGRPELPELPELPGPSGPSDRLLVVAHHLVIDGVSWRILLADLFAAYRCLLDDVPVELPPKTTSYDEWSRRILEFADTDDGRDQIAYWTSLPYDQAPRLPRDTHGPEEAAHGTAPGGEPNPGSGAEAHRRELDADLTRRLRELPAPAGARLHDILLTAVARALGTWTGAEQVQLDVERHGREDLLPDLDLTRTVGWFSDFHPVLLPVLPGAAPMDRLLAVRGRLASVPRNGAGYVPLRYGGPRGVDSLAGVPRSEVTFNYLGQLDAALPPDAPASIVGEIPGRLRADSGPRPYLIEITAGILDGRLWFTWTYSADVLRPSTIETLAEDTLAALREFLDRGDR